MGGPGPAAEEANARENNYPVTSANNAQRGVVNPYAHNNGGTTGNNNAGNALAPPTLHPPPGVALSNPLVPTINLAAAIQMNGVNGAANGNYFGNAFNASPVTAYPMPQNDAMGGDLMQGRNFDSLFLHNIAKFHL